MPRLRSASGVVANVNEATAARLARAGWRPVGQVQAVDQRPAAGGPPAGPIAEVLAWVGEDRERAGRALEAERAKGDKARGTLVAQLEQLAGNE